MSRRDITKESFRVPTRYESLLFPFGYIISTDRLVIKDDEYAFFGSWSREQYQGFHFFLHPDQTIFTYTIDNRVFFLIGHAYNPIRLNHQEGLIVEELAQAWDAGEESYIELLNELSGVFITGYLMDNVIRMFGDATGTLTAYYGERDGVAYIVSHTALLPMLCDVKTTDYVSDLVNYRFYPLYGNGLPGDITPYEFFYRLVPNHSLSWDGTSFTHRRFFPTHALPGTSNEAEYAEAIRKSTDILKNSMKLITYKWKSPAISLTGGRDSKTTFSCATDSFEKYRYFSHISKPEEEVDAEAAHIICNAMGLNHEVIQVPSDLKLLGDGYPVFEKIIELNCGNIGSIKTYEAAKRMVLRSSGIELDVKSHVSEIGRAYFHKVYSKKSFPRRPTPRLLTTMYKPFVHNRKLVKSTDRIFRRCLDEYYSNDEFQKMSWVDLYFWEFRNGPLQITGEQRISFDITIPYNNRILLCLLLSTPLDARIEDRPHKDIAALANPAVDALGISVTNVKHTAFRSGLERLYLEVHSRLPRWI